MEPIKFYMYRPYEEGRRRYYVVPENLADSIMKDFHLTKSKNFFKKTDTILKSTKTFIFSFPVFTYIFVYLYDLKIT